MEKRERRESSGRKIKTFLKKGKKERKKKHEGAYIPLLRT